MKIEVSNWYINAKGDVVKIEFKQIDMLYPYVCRYYSYMPNGRRIIGQESPQDLICEVVPEIYETYKSGGYDSYKDFLIAHYEYYSGEHYEQTDL